MTRTEGSVTASERGRHLHEVSRSATRMVLERITLENLGLRLVKLPLCTEAEAVQIEDLIPRAKRGLAMSLKSGRVLKSEVQNLLRYTTPIAVQEFASQIALKEHQNTLPEYAHLLATLSILINSGRVSFYGLPETPQNIDFDLGMAESYWHLNTYTIEHLWTVMCELEELTRTTLYSPQEIQFEKLLKLGHFYAVSQEISKIFVS